MVTKAYRLRQRREEGPGNSVPEVSIVRKLYVVLKYTMKRCTNLTINDIVKLNTAAF